MKQQKIKFTVTGRSYVTHYGRRIYLDEVMRLHTNSNIGYQHNSNSSGFKVTIIDSETATVEYITE